MTPLAHPRKHRRSLRPVLCTLRSGALAIALAFAGATRAPARAPTPAQPELDWLGTWGTAPQLVEEANVPPELLAGELTLRQTMRVSVGGEHLRVTVSNAFGTQPLRIHAAHIARAERAGTPDIVPGTDHRLSFGGAAEVEIPAGGTAVSDAIAFPLEPFADVAISLHVAALHRDVTGHPGSRTTSFIQPGSAAAEPTLPRASTVDRWFLVTGIDVRSRRDAAAVVILGDSLTDGRGSTTNGNDRWPDQLARRLQADPRTRRIAVLNMGIGGNRVLRDGPGPAALKRLDRDVLEQPGARWLIVFEGINDIGTAAAARARGQEAPSAAEVIAGLEQIARRARERGLKVYGATLLPAGTSFYDVTTFEADRTAVNAWIRTTDAFDAVIDFEAAVRDPDEPGRLAAAYDSGDRLHLNPAGYKALADAIPLELFFTKPERPADSR